MPSMNDWGVPFFPRAFFGDYKTLPDPPPQMNRPPPWYLKSDKDIEQEV